MRLLLAIVLFLAVLPARAAEPKFTHYILALSWNASWCALDGDKRGADQCDARHEIGFTLHGLWPQREDGWPEYCYTDKANPTRAETAAMADIMGSTGLAWHQWNKHGRCSGLSASDYFGLSRAAWSRIRRPAVLRKVEKRLRVLPRAVLDAFLEVNPGLRADQLVVTCTNGLVHEVRVCLEKDLTPRACSPRVARGCNAKSVVFPPMR